MNWFLKHLADAEKTQTYSQHARFAIWNSLGLIYYGILGVIHGLFPPLFPFDTSSKVIRSYSLLVASRRHNDEILEIQGSAYEKLARKTQQQKS
jgi:hypothetical protein